MEKMKILAGETAGDIYAKLSKVNIVDGLTARRLGDPYSQNELDRFLKKNTSGVEVSVLDESGDFTFAHYGDKWKGWLVKDDEEKFFFVYYLHAGTVGEPNLRSDYHFEELKPNTTTRFITI